MEEVKKLSNLQIELLKLFNYNLNDNQLGEIKSLLSRYFAEKALMEADKIWDEKGWDDTTMDNWLNEHKRTPSK